MVCSKNSTNDDIQKVCEAWGGSTDQCKDSFTFSIVTDLYKADREGSNSFLPLIYAKYGGNGSDQGSFDYTQDHSSSPPFNCPQVIRVPHCFLHCSNAALMKYLDVPQPTASLKEIVHMPQFWIFLCLMLLAWSAFAGVVTLSDTLCFMMLGRFGGDYGRQRVWGALGWGVSVVLAGALIDVVSGGPGTPKDYTPAFILTLAIFFIDFFSISKDFGILHEEFVVDVFVSLTPHFIKVVLLDDDEEGDQSQFSDVHPLRVGFAMVDNDRDEDADDQGKGARIEEFEENP